MKAIDHDSAPHASLTYSIDSADFRVDAESGELSASRSILDREIADSYEFNVTASDSVNKKTVRVRIELADVNDNKPAFDMPVYRFQLAENRLVKSVGFVQAVDADKPGTGFSMIRYAIVNDETQDSDDGDDDENDQDDWLDAFRIDEETGELHLLRELDYEAGKLKKYNFFILI